MNSRNARGRIGRRCARAGMLLPVLALAALAVPQAHADVPALGDDFLWGVASAGFQSEGSAPDSNWSRSVAASNTDDPYQDSVDFYHRYPQDIALAKNLGVTVYRLSVEWARVEPQPGVWDESAFAYYDNVIGAIKAAGMRPMITLDHWVFPGWEVDRGGWANPGMVDDWLANARKVVDRYADDDPMWVTINEPGAYGVLTAAQGALRPDQLPAFYDRLVTVHRSIYDYIHERQPGAMVTSNTAYLPGVESAAEVPFEDRVADKMDFIGIDYYYGDVPGPNALANKPWLNTLQPEGIYYALRHYARQFPGKPLYIVENGMPTENGQPRADGVTRAQGLRDTVYWIQRAEADGMPVIGYNYWSLTDNYEWGSYTPRFGLYTVDVTTDPTLTRKPTDGVPAYRDIIANDGVSADYLPTIPIANCSMVDFPSSCTEPVTVPGH